jgi:hypothetical protein
MSKKPILELTPFEAEMLSQVMNKYHPPASDDNFDECAADEERRQRALGIHPLQGTHVDVSTLISWQGLLWACLFGAVSWLVILITIYPLASP